MGGVSARAEALTDAIDRLPRLRRHRPPRTRHRRRQPDHPVGIRRQRQRDRPRRCARPAHHQRLRCAGPHHHHHRPADRPHRLHLRRPGQPAHRHRPAQPRHHLHLQRLRRADAARQSGHRGHRAHLRCRGASRAFARHRRAPGRGRPWMAGPDCGAGIASERACKASNAATCPAAAPSARTEYIYTDDGQLIGEHTPTAAKSSG
jgi:hypothetical protein